MIPSSVKYGVYNNRIGFTSEITTTDVVKLIGIDLPLVKTMADLDTEIFPTDDGLNVHREGLLMYRIAMAVAATMGRDGRYQARELMYESERHERDLAAVAAILTTGETQIMGRGVRMEDV